MFDTITQIEKVVKSRKMIREYDLNRQQIPDQLITKLIRNAHRAPSAGHTQVQEFILVSNILYGLVLDWMI
jgi:nitroreductase